MVHRGDKAQLFLNGKFVGGVLVQGTDNSWSHGVFTPGEEFSEFAMLFGQWSLLMHAEDDQHRQSEEDLSAMREAECAIDRLKTQLYFPETDSWCTVAQINIDGELIEWKEY